MFLPAKLNTLQEQSLPGGTVTGADKAGNRFFRIEADHHRLRLINQPLNATLPFVTAANDPGQTADAPFHMPPMNCDDVTHLNPAPNDTQAAATFAEVQKTSLRGIDAFYKRA
jgi:hypothetical protein